MATSRTYTFTVLCKSGLNKSTTFIASNFNEAIKMLQDFVEAN